MPDKKVLRLTVRTQNFSRGEHHQHVVVAGAKEFSQLRRGMFGSISQQRRQSRAQFAWILLFDFRQLGGDAIRAEHDPVAQLDRRCE